MEPCLYALIRNDLDSLNPGKAIAQGMHAANQFTYFHQHDGGEDLLELWMGPRAFGTTVVLEASEKQIRSLVALAEKVGFTAGLVIDESYPYFDGVLLTREEMTCGYIFGDRNNPYLKAIKEGLNRYK